ncbi:A-kinase anchor protein 4-like [Eudromia elegans]
MANSGKRGEKQMNQGKKSDDTSGSKALMVSANCVGSDMVFSLLETMQVQKKEGKKVPACVFLKKVLLEHTKEVISDLIDSTMKNLHSVTGVLMTDSDFVSTLKKNLFNVGRQKATEVLEAMVKRLLRDISEEKQARGQSLAFTAVKARSQSDFKSQGMRISAMKGEMHNLGKDKDRGASTSYSSSNKYSEKNRSMDKYAKDLIMTALSLIKQHLLQQTNGNKNTSEYGSAAFGFVHRDSNLENAGKRQSSKSLAAYSGAKHDIQEQLNYVKVDLKNKLLSFIQDLLSEGGSSMDESSSETQRSSNKYGNGSDSQKQVSIGQPRSSMDQFDSFAQVNEQLVGQLVDSVMKLCQLIAQGNADLAGSFSDDHNAA